MPSGGKFVNGTGSIATNGNKMDIAGNNKNNVIAWGGGFNIGKEASVNFTTNQKNYLNLDYTNKASQILGKLNGGTNNIYLVNPSGVLIGKDASINANKFGVSTSPFDNNAIQTFSNNGSFSPVFSANKGDIVNMGTISANEIVLVGNRVTNVGNYVDEKGRKQVAFGSFNKKDSLANAKLEITANHTDLHANGNTIGTIDSINVTAEGNNAKIEVGQSATGWTDVQLGINQNGNNVTTTIYASIKDTEDWSSFADIINGGNANNIDTFKLIKDIDFKDAGAIEPVGNDISNPFSGNFYGNGHTLSNLLINADGKRLAGLFGYINGGSVQDLTIDGLNFQGSALVIGGGFAARINNGTFSNIVLNNIGNISGHIAGGFAGRIDNGTFSNIVLNNIENIVGDFVGGFAGYIYSNNSFSNIVLNDIGNITATQNAGGFAGEIVSGTLSNIVLNNIRNISGILAGGFAGWIANGTLSNIVLNNIGDISGFNSAGGFAGLIDNGTLSNIVLNNIGNISGNYQVGGFAGWIDNGTFSNIVLNNIGNISGVAAGGFAGSIANGTLSNIVLNNIGDISATQNAGGFVGRIDNGIFSNIVLNNIENISGNHVGGFAGWIDNGTLSNIVLNNIENISGNHVGGFAGWIDNGTLSNIVLNNIGDIGGNYQVGGFAGSIASGTLSNIVLNNIGDISGNIAGGFAGWIDNGTLSNIVLNNIGNISGVAAGGFAGLIDNGTLSNIVLNNIGDIGGNYQAGGFAGEIGKGTSNINNIVLNNIRNISATGEDAGGFAGYIYSNNSFSNIVLNDIGNITATQNAGGFVGRIDNGIFSNIVLNNIGNISGFNSAGGFAGWINNGTFSNIVLNNIGDIGGNYQVGGFAGWIDNGTLSNIVLNNIGDIGGNYQVGGFAGWIANGTLSNIVLNNIGDISGNIAGGFAGWIDNGTLSNIVLNNIENISGNHVGGFVGYGSPASATDIYFYGAMNLIGGNTNQNHINSHNQTALNLTNTTNLQIIQNHMQSGSTLKNLEYVTGTNGNSYLYMVTNGKIGDANSEITFDGEEYKLLQSGSTLKNLEYVIGTNGNSYLHMVTNGKIGGADSEITFDGEEYKLLQSGSTLKNLEYVIGTNGNSYLHMVTNGKIGGADSEITFDNEEYKLPKVSNNTTSSTPPSISNGDNLSSVTLEASDFDVSILESIINDILNKEYVLNLDDWTNFGALSKDYATILSYLLENTQDETLKESIKQSIKQSLEFYAEFNKGETNGLKAEFEKWYGNDSSSTYNSSMKKYEGIAASIETLKNYVNGTLKPKLERIQSNLNRFEFLKAEIARLDKVYQEALENKLLPYNQLEIIYKDTKEKIDAYYTEAKGLLATLKKDNKPFLEALIGKTYNFKDKYNDVTGSFSFVGSNIGGNIKSSINGGLDDKPILTLPDNDDSGNNQTIDGGNSAEIANTLAKQTELASKEAVITLPAQEKEDVITEERELGRVCIVSDNAKTNNPCVAAF